jgi:hypothetical protein
MADRDTFGGDIWQPARAAFRRREHERGLIRTRLEPLLAEFAAMEHEFSRMSVFGSEERYRLSRARLEVLRVLRSLDAAAQTRSEGSLRAMESIHKSSVSRR